MCSSWGVVTQAMDTLSSLIKTGGDFLRKPSTVLVLTNAATAWVLLYALSEGRPLRALRRLAWKAALAAVPKSLVDKELGSIKRKIARDLIGSTLDGEEIVLSLPAAGWTLESVRETLGRYGAADAALWRSGRISGCVYHGGDALAEVQTDAFRAYAISNPLHPDVFPRLRKVRVLRPVEWIVRGRFGYAPAKFDLPLPHSRHPLRISLADGGGGRLHDSSHVQRRPCVLRNDDERRY